MKLSKVTCWVIAFGGAISFVLFEYACLLYGIAFPPVLIFGFALPLIILPPLIYAILRTFMRDTQ